MAILSLEENSEKLAEIYLTTGTIQLNFQHPFLWASGFYMPIYNDNRLLLRKFRYRKFISDCFMDFIESENIEYDIIAGISTGSISPATTLADRLQVPLVYVRKSPKQHGTASTIEGIGKEENLAKKKIILIEDTISSGETSAHAVQAIRESQGAVDYCFSIFNYGFRNAERIFNGTHSFLKEIDKKIDSPCAIRSILNYKTLQNIAEQKKYIDGEQKKSLEEWFNDPFIWGVKQGFPPVKKV